MVKEQLSPKVSRAYSKSIFWEALQKRVKYQLFFCHRTCPRHCRNLCRIEESLRKSAGADTNYICKKSSVDKCVAHFMVLGLNLTGYRSLCNSQIMIARPRRDKQALVSPGKVGLAVTAHSILSSKVDINWSTLSRRL